MFMYVFMGCIEQGSLLTVIYCSEGDNMEHTHLSFFQKAVLHQTTLNLGHAQRIVSRRQSLPVVAVHIRLSLRICHATNNLGIPRGHVQKSRTCRELQRNLCSEPRSGFSTSLSQGFTSTQLGLHPNSQVQVDSSSSSPTPTPTPTTQLLAEDQGFIQPLR